MSKTVSRHTLPPPAAEQPQLYTRPYTLVLVHYEQTVRPCLLLAPPSNVNCTHAHTHWYWYTMSKQSGPASSWRRSPSDRTHAHKHWYTMSKQSGPASSWRRAPSDPMLLPGVVAQVEYESKV